MKSIQYSLSLFILILFSSASLVGQSKTLELERFDGLSAGGNIELILIPDSENYAEIEVEDIDIDKLEIKKKGTMLKFNLRNNGIFNFFKGNGKAYIKLHYTEDLEIISSSASADISSRAIIKSNDLSLKSSSGSSINLEIECNFLDVSVSSGADIDVDGSFDDQDISVSSGGNYNAQNVKSSKVVAKASSGGYIKVWASDSLKGRASSGGNIDYKGNPGRSNISSSSGGSIESID